MFPFKKAKGSKETFNLAEAFLSVVDRTQATIQFKPDGTILTANDNFLQAFGYTLAEVVGKHHSIFINPDYASSAEYRSFWKDLAEGKFFTDRFARVAKDGSIVWIQATYAPCLDAAGRATRVIKIATNVTHRQNAIDTIAYGMSQLSAGNLTHRVPSCAVPDIDRLGNAFNQALEQLSRTMTAVAGVSQAVERTASDLGQGSLELSRRTEVQAATLEQTAAAIEQLTSTVNAAAEGAKDVENSANQAITTAKKGGKVAEDAISAMSQIEKSSNRVSQVITVIDDIAFQTNLLALNAGIEAARAGESGRGFAVVAAEVRALALRSADAAAEINGLIKESSGFVKSGVGRVVQAGEELEKIIAGIAGIHSHISVIASGAREQAVTLGEINTGVAQLDSMTQQNAAMVVESGEASQVLVNHARELAKQVSEFRINASAKASADQPDHRSAATQRPALRRAS
jgi:methyl-accepting chemotaxis protein